MMKIGSLIQGFVDFVAVWIPTGIVLSLTTYVVMALWGNSSGAFDIGVGVFAVQVAPLIGFILALPQTYLILLLKRQPKR